MQSHPGLAEAIQYHLDHESSWHRDFLTETGRDLVIVVRWINKASVDGFLHRVKIPG